MSIKGVQYTSRTNSQSYSRGSVSKKHQASEDQPIQPQPSNNYIIPLERTQIQDHPLTSKSDIQDTSLDYESLKSPLLLSFHKQSHSPTKKLNQSHSPIKKLNQSHSPIKKLNQPLFDKNFKATDNPSALSSPLNKKIILRKSRTVNKISIVLFKITWDTIRNPATAFTISMWFATSCFFISKLVFFPLSFPLFIGSAFFKMASHFRVKALFSSSLMLICSSLMLFKASMMASIASSLGSIPVMKGFAVILSSLLSISPAGWIVLGILSSALFIYGCYKFLNKKNVGFRETYEKYKNCPKNSYEYKTYQSIRKSGFHTALFGVTYSPYIKHFFNLIFYKVNMLFYPQSRHNRPRLSDHLQESSKKFFNADLAEKIVCLFFAPKYYLITLLNNLAKKYFPEIDLK